MENGTPLVRCCNNGLTCWIDAEGRIRQIFTSDSHGIYGPGFMIARIPFACIRREKNRADILSFARGLVRVGMHGVGGSGD